MDARWQCDQLRVTAQKLAGTQSNGRAGAKGAEGLKGKRLVRRGACEFADGERQAKQEPAEEAAEAVRPLRCGTAGQQAAAGRPPSAEGRCPRTVAIEAEVQWWYE